jgi:N-acetylglucosaminyldiphosphoundecaprenol N-acetyl-beta-D-mannosaminyltransferase
MKNFKHINFKLSLGNYNLFIDEIINAASRKQSSYVCVANVHMYIEAYRNPSFNQIVENADIVTPDGMPLAKSLKWLYGIEQDRVAGMDLLPDVLKEAEKQGLGVFFYGGTDAMLAKTRDHISNAYPGITKIGYFSPPFRSLTLEEENAIIDQINSSGADIVFVVLGCPKQEKWMETMKGKINAVMIGIGAALPVMVGIQKRAPLWMQKSSLEWLYRLMQEPRRLFKRYFITNSLFIYIIIKEKMRLKFFINNE